MRKTIVTLVAAAMSAVAMAQPAAGKFSIIPRVGVSLARMSGGGIASGDAVLAGATSSELRSKTGFTGGLDIDYQLASQVSLSIGAHYVQQGCKYGNSQTEMSPAGSTVKEYMGISEHTVQTHSLNVPLLVGYYVAPGLAVRTGVQLEVPVSAHEKYAYARYNDKEGDDVQVDAPVKVDNDLDASMRKVSFAVPVGISFEYMNVILDARYNIGLGGVQKKGFNDSAKNRVFMFTAAYRFVL